MRKIVYALCLLLLGGAAPSFAAECDNTPYWSHEVAATCNVRDAVTSGVGNATSANQTNVQATPGSNSVKAVGVQGVDGGKPIPGSVADGGNVTTGSLGDIAATDSTSSWSVVSLLKGLWSKINTGNGSLSTIATNTTGIATAAKQPPFAATDGSTTITTGGTAQNLFSGTTPTNGWSVINPESVEDCWASDTTTAVANGSGSIRIAVNGGGYETPSARKPIGAVSVVCATTGHKLTASRW